MKTRLSFRDAAPGVYEAMKKLQARVNASGLEQNLLELVKLRVSMLNGCAFCIDMHWRDARRLGESEQRLYGLNALAESDYYSARERAALRFAEAVTELGQGVPDDIYAGAAAELSDAELVELTLAVIAINGWNRLCITFRQVMPTTT
jgi:AhpD family alkylhydroperoxidase